MHRQKLFDLIKLVAAQAVTDAATMAPMTLPPDIAGDPDLEWIYQSEFEFARAQILNGIRKQ